MPVRIVVDVFSGRQNPVIELRGKEAEELLARSKPTTRRATAAAAPTEVPALGYRGLIVEQVGKRKPGLPRSFRFAAGLVGVEPVRVAADEAAEEFIFGPKGPAEWAGLDRKVLSFVRRQLPELRARVTAPAAAALPLRRKRPAIGAQVQACPGGPIAEPNWWNDAGQRQLRNNCYNYSTNYRTDTFAQPGNANNRTITTLTCSAIRRLAILDKLIDAPNANNRCPGTGHLVALVVAPGFDFHWYRKGEDGLWTHKVGPAPVTPFDNAGNLIVDPRTADRGPYINFCGFMVVMHGHIRLQ